MWLFHFPFQANYNHNSFYDPFKVDRDVFIRSRHTWLPFPSENFARLLRLQNIELDANESGCRILPSLFMQASSSTSTFRVIFQSLFWRLFPDNFVSNDMPSKVFWREKKCHSLIRGHEKWLKLSGRNLWQASREHSWKVFHFKMMLITCMFSSSVSLPLSIFESVLGTVQETAIIEVRIMARAGIWIGLFNVEKTLSFSLHRTTSLYCWNSLSLVYLPAATHPLSPPLMSGGEKLTERLLRWGQEMLTAWHFQVVSRRGRDEMRGREEMRVRAAF